MTTLLWRLELKEHSASYLSIYRDASFQTKLSSGQGDHADINLRLYLHTRRFSYITLQTAHERPVFISSFSVSW